MPDTKVKFSLDLPGKLRAKIKKASTKGKTTMSAVVIERLSDSFKKPTAQKP